MASHRTRFMNAFRDCELQLEGMFGRQFKSDCEVQKLQSISTNASVRVYTSWDSTPETHEIIAIELTCKKPRRNLILVNYTVLVLHEAAARQKKEVTLESCMCVEHTESSHLVVLHSMYNTEKHTSSYKCGTEVLNRLWRKLLHQWKVRSTIYAFSIFQNRLFKMTFETYNKSRRGVNVIFIK